jgi:hypothetical protein
MSPSSLDLTGKTFNYLTGIQRLGVVGNGNSLWQFKCKCGNIVSLPGYTVKNGKTKSCGCYKIEATKKANTKHGMSFTRIHGCWINMKRRCYNKKNRSYPNYGARGITVCKDWFVFTNFYKWAMKNGYQSNLTLDRIDNDKGYYPKNCRWTNLLIQANNKQKTKYFTFKGEVMSIPDIARQLHLNPKLVSARIRNGKSISEALELN